MSQTTPSQERPLAQLRQSDVILRATGIRRVFQMGDTSIEVLKGVDLTIRPGEFIAIEGRSGSGKSTLMHILGALDGLDAGKVYFDDHDYTRLTLSAQKGLWPQWMAGIYDGIVSLDEWINNLRFRYQLLLSLLLMVSLWGLVGLLMPRFPIASAGTGNRYIVILPSPILLLLVLPMVRGVLWLIRWCIRCSGRLHVALFHRDVRASAALGSPYRNKQFGFVFQFYHLLPELNVLENTLLAPMIEKSWFSYAGSRKQLVAKAKELLGQFGLSHRLEHRPSQLSGGERQRVAIARALMNSPRVLFADEPTGNLDAETGLQIMAVLEKLHRDQGQTIVMVTHDRSLARTADRVLVLKEGRLQKAEDSAISPA